MYRKLTLEDDNYNTFNENDRLRRIIREKDTELWFSRRASLLLFVALLISLVWQMR